MLQSVRARPVVSEAETNVLGHADMVAGSTYPMDGGMTGYCDWPGAGPAPSNTGCLASYLSWSWTSATVQIIVKFNCKYEHYIIVLLTFFQHPLYEYQIYFCL